MVDTQVVQPSRYVTLGMKDAPDVHMGGLLDIRDQIRKLFDANMAQIGDTKFISKTW